jgi:polar amino acid transport system substrate-binding protein
MMRRFAIGIAAHIVVLSACSSGTQTPPASPPASSPLTAADCAKSATLTTSGTITIGTDNPAFPPYFAGGETKAHKQWKFNDPYTGKGFEDAVAYEVAKRLGFSQTQVKWVVAPFAQTYKPGPKNYDFAIEQIDYSAKRAKAVDFSDSYYDKARAVVARKGTPITEATSISDLKDFKLASQIGTTDYEFITDVIKPNKEPGAYNSLADAVAAINAHQVDGLVVDLPTALYMADPFVQEVKNSTVVGQFPVQPGGAYFGMTFQKGSNMVTCVDLALQEMKADHTLESITTEWLSEKTNVGKVPVFSSS